MAALVTQEEALDQLRLQSTAISAEELIDVMAKAEQASAIVINYLKRPDPELNPADPLRPSPFAPTESPLGPMPNPPYAPTPWDASNCPPLVKGIILIVLTSLYDGRTPDDALLSDPVCSALTRMRDPALA
jgi:hypothetical protein